MASANVSFDNIPASIRKPGKYLEFNTKLAVRTLATNPQTVLIIAQKTADGTAAEKTPVQVFDTDTAGKLFGVGSQAARMVRVAMRAYGYVDLSVLPVADDSAGVAASGSLKLTGDATAQGVITLTVADTEVSVAATAEDSAETLATALQPQSTPKGDLPVTAQAATGTVTLTAKNKGHPRQRIVLAYSNTVPGITPTLTAMTGGQKDPDIVEALTAVFAADYTIYCVPWAVQAPLTALREHLDNIGGPMEQRGAIGVFASTGTLSAATTLAGQLNAGRITGALFARFHHAARTDRRSLRRRLGKRGRPGAPAQYVVAHGRHRAARGLALGPHRAGGLPEKRRNPAGSRAGRCRPDRPAISTYTVNAEGTADVSLFGHHDDPNAGLRAQGDPGAHFLRFPREKLSTRTPAKVRSEILDVLRGLESLEIVEEVDANADGVVVERDLQDANRLDAKIPTDVVNGLHVFAGRIDLLL